MLTRSSKACGSWYWNLKDVAEPGLEFAPLTAARMSEVREKRDLLMPSSLEWA
ncbi:hypothetical protein SSIG_03922 [Streptomyces filamentosus NRRL 11379]|nr:hypothetical protein SSIG_03922 [Streptomyces filamentosus NRRL 11379]